MVTRVLSLAFQGISIVTGLLFCFGYAFLSGYYARFKLDVSTLDPPLWSFLLAGFSGLVMFVVQLGIFIAEASKSHKILAGIALALFLALGTVRYKFWFRRIIAKLPLKAKAQRPSPAWSKVVGHVYWTASYSFIFFAGVCTFLFVSGSSLASQLLNHPEATIQLFFKPGEDKGLPQDLLSANTSRNLIPIIQTKDLVIVCVRNETPTAPYVVARSNLQGSKTHP